MGMAKRVMVFGMLPWEKSRDCDMKGPPNLVRCGTAMIAQSPEDCKGGKKRHKKPP